MMKFNKNSFLTDFNYLNIQRKFVDFRTLFITLAIVGLIWVVTFFLKFVLRRISYNALLPGRKFPWYDAWGDFAELQKNRIGRGRNSLNAAWVKLLGSNCDLFRKEALFCLWISYFPFVMLVKAEAVEEVLKGSKMLQKGWMYKWLEDMFGSGLLTSNGMKWKSRRRLLTPCFHSDILKKSMPVFNEQARLLVRILGNKMNEDFIDINMPITLCVLDIICETIFGVKIGSQENVQSQYVQSFKRTGKMFMERLTKWWLWPDYIYRFTNSGKEFFKHVNFMQDFTRSIIREKKKKSITPGSQVCNKSKRKALMDLLLELHFQTKDFSEEDVRDEIDTFAGAGHETTASSITFALYLIGLHRDVQDKIHQELNEILRDDIEQEITLEDVSKMKYLDCVLKECKRLYPPVPHMTRLATQDINICGHIVPKGATCVIPIYYLHRDEEVFPNPEKFDPTRFSAENSNKRHPFAYVPFSAGPRNCIGQAFARIAEKVVMSTILRNFTIESLDGRDKVQPKFAVSLKSSIPIRLKIRARF